MFTCTVGLLSGFGTWDGTSVHDPHIHDPGIQYEPLVNAYDLTIAPILKGKSNCPAQFGRKPGIMSDPATGFIFANRVPEGNPSDPSYVLPLLDKVHSAIARVHIDIMTSDG